jgi:hypothetical protein
VQVPAPGDVDPDDISRETSGFERRRRSECERHFGQTAERLGNGQERNDAHAQIGRTRTRRRDRLSGPNADGARLGRNLFEARVAEERALVLYRSPLARNDDPEDAVFFT